MQARADLANGCMWRHLHIHFGQSFALGLFLTLPNFELPILLLKFKEFIVNLIQLMLKGVDFAFLVLDINHVFQTLEQI